MLVAQSVLVWFGGLFMIGFVGFFLLCVFAVFWVIGKISHALFWPGRSEPEQLPRRPRTRRLVCEYSDCQHENDMTALYCARCGRRLYQAQTV